MIPKKYKNAFFAKCGAMYLIKELKKLFNIFPSLLGNKNKKILSAFIWGRLFSIKKTFKISFLKKYNWEF